MNTIQFFVKQLSMELSNKPLKEYIDTGEYFKDSREWYKHIYIRPFTQRSFIFILTITICTLFLGVIINIYSLFPAVVKVQYSISAESSANKTAQIIEANRFENDPQASIADILIRSYVKHREAYSYANLRKQFIFLKNNSTRIVFRRFYNFMNIDNPSSPVLKYQKEIKRRPEIISADYPSDSKAIIKFRTIAEDVTGVIAEDMVWETTISYEMDKINPDLRAGSRFNFTVTDYQLKLLEDRKKK